MYKIVNNSFIVKFLAQPNENSFLDEDNAGSFVFPDSTKKPIPQKIKNLSEESELRHSRRITVLIKHLSSFRM